MDDTTVDPFIDQSIRTLYNNESGKVRESNLYDFIYDLNKKKNSEVKKEIEKEKELYLKGRMTKNVKYYKNFVNLTDKLITKMKGNMVEGSQFNRKQSSALKFRKSSQ